MRADEPGRRRGRWLEAWIGVVGRLVPARRRADWSEEWRGEAWYGYRAVDAPRRRALHLAFAALCDASFLRFQHDPFPALSPRRGDDAMQTFWMDLRYGLRTLVRVPLFTATVVVTLGLGIGAATAIYSVVDAVLLRPLPYRDAERLVMFWQREPGAGVEEDWLSPAQYADLRDGLRSFDALAIAVGGSTPLVADGKADEAGFVRATSGYLTMLGAVPALGRVFDDSDDVAGAPPVVLLTHAFWQRRFGGDPGVVGRTVRVGGRELAVVGVLPRGLLLDREVMPTVGGGRGIDLVISLALTPASLENRGEEHYNVVGRLRPEASLATAQAEVDGLAAAMRAAHPESYGESFAIDLVPLLDEVVGDARRPLAGLLAAVGLLLLVACGNVANLLLARGAVRRRELGIRAAVGAGRGRLVRQLLTEGGLLATAGGALGVAVAVGCVRILRRLGDAVDLPRLGEVGVDLRVLAFASALTAATTLVFALLPALRGSRVDPREALGDSRGVAGGATWARFDLASALVAGEVAASLVLLIVGALLARSFVALLAVDPGFAADNVLTFKVAVAGERYDEAAARLAFYRELLAEVRAEPGVVAAGTMSVLPFGAGVGWGRVEVEGRAAAPDEKTVVDFRLAGPGVLEALGIPLVRGRFFDDADDPTRDPVVVVDEAFAARIWPGEDPIGKRISAWDAGWATVVGVAGAVKQTALDLSPRILAYYAHGQVGSSARYLAVKTTADPAALAESLARVVRRREPEAVVADVAPMSARLAASLARRRFAMLLVQSFAAITLLLAAVGLYGVVAYRVSRGAPGFGLRIALGATPRAIVRLVLGHGLAMAGVGLAAGLLVALASARLLRGMLFGVGATDPPTYLAVAALLAAVTLLACWIPARRASRVDPLAGLRG